MSVGLESRVLTKTLANRSTDTHNLPLSDKTYVTPS
jgi:hypothetical protein